MLTNFAFELRRLWLIMMMRRKISLHLVVAVGSSDRIFSHGGVGEPALCADVSRIELCVAVLCPSTGHTSRSLTAAAVRARGRILTRGANYMAGALTPLETGIAADVDLHSRQFAP